MAKITANGKVFSSPLTVIYKTPKGWTLELSFYPDGGDVDAHIYNKRKTTDETITAVDLDDYEDDEVAEVTSNDFLYSAIDAFSVDNTKIPAYDEWTLERIKPTNGFSSERKNETKFDPSQYDFFKASYTLDGTNRVKNTNGIVDAQGTLEMAQRHGATNLNLVGVKDGTETDIPLSDVGISESKDEAMSLKGFLEALEEKLVKQFDLDEEEVKNYLDTHTQEMQELLDDKELSLKEKVLFVRGEITGEKDESKKSESVEDDCKRTAHDILNYIKKATGYKNSYLVRVSVNDDEDDFYIKYNLGTNGNNYILYAGVTDYSITDLKGENTYVEGSTDLSGAMTSDLDAFCKQIKSPKKESKEPTEEKLGYEKGHKNSKGEDAPWVIRSHEDNRILASFAKKTDAEEHLQRMKQYSKQESMSADELDKYIKDVKSLLKSKYGMDFNDKDTCRLNVGWLEKLDAMFYQGKPVEDGAKEVAAFCGYNKNESKQSEANGPFDAPIKDWYMGAYKEDDLGDRLNGTFKGALQTLMRGDDIYDYIGVGDSLIRERLFSKLAEMLDVDYDEIYNVWLNEGAASNELTAKLNKIGIKRTRTIPPTIKDKVKRLGRGVLPPKIVKVTGESKKSERLFNKAEMEKIALSEASSLDNYRKDVISELAVSFHYGEDGATKLADKYSDTINDAYVEGESLPYETARFIARQDGNGYANESKKSESKKSEVRLELIDTIVVPKWLWEAYNFGNEYGEDLDEHEQNILSEFKEKYADCHLDDEDEESYFSSYNDFDSYGGQCYTVKVYKEQ